MWDRGPRAPDYPLLRPGPRATGAGGRQRSYSAPGSTGTRSRSLNPALAAIDSNPQVRQNGVRGLWERPDASPGEACGRFWAVRGPQGRARPGNFNPLVAAMLLPALLLALSAVCGVAAAASCDLANPEIHISAKGFTVSSFPQGVSSLRSFVLEVTKGPSTARFKRSGVLSLADGSLSSDCRGFVPETLNPDLTCPEIFFYLSKETIRSFTYVAAGESEDDSHLCQGAQFSVRKDEDIPDPAESKEDGTNLWVIVGVCVGVVVIIVFIIVIVVCAKKKASRDRARKGTIRDRSNSWSRSGSYKHVRDSAQNKLVEQGVAARNSRRSGRGSAAGGALTDEQIALLEDEDTDDFYGVKLPQGVTPAMARRFYTMQLDEEAQNAADQPDYGSRIRKAPGPRKLTGASATSSAAKGAKGGIPGGVEMRSRVARGAGESEGSADSYSYSYSYSDEESDDKSGSARNDDGGASRAAELSASTSELCSDDAHSENAPLKIPRDDSDASSVRETSGRKSVSAESSDSAGGSPPSLTSPASFAANNLKPEVETLITEEPQAHVSLRRQARRP